MAELDPVCLLHGKKQSEHDCLYCCLCFKSLTIDECNIGSLGFPEDVCRPCAEVEASIVAEVNRAERGGGQYGS